MKTDIEIANSIILKPIQQIASQLGIDINDIEPYGKNIAKIPLSYINESKVKNNNLILVTSISPTKAGIGKTTVSIGLSLGLNKIGKKSIVALREPSLGPCFGMKGGACGGGYAQVLPMDKINLHFTGDFHAITSAHNMIAALMDNYLYQNKIQMKEILWKRVIDINDRGLRQIITGIGDNSNGGLRNSGFDITPASEIMAILCLSSDLNDLYNRIDNILLGYKLDNSEFLVKELNITGSIVALLKDAIMPNLVQTTENTPAIIHGGPFANIAHGCNSIIATKMALSLSEYVVTEAGFGADLGAEKFFDIKCRQLGIAPKLTVVVATCKGLKLHGGLLESEINKPNIEALRLGFKNLKRHVNNIKRYGQTVLVVFNKYAEDTEEEISELINYCNNELNVKCVVNNAYIEGSKGAIELARIAVDLINNSPSTHYVNAVYKSTDTITQKIDYIVKKIYKATTLTFTDKALKQLEKIENNNIYSLFPVCIAKTQYSFTDNPTLYGAPDDFNFTISDIIINRGAEFIVAIAGKMMRMPGLPKKPAAENITIKDNQIIGLS